MELRRKQPHSPEWLEMLDALKLAENARSGRQRRRALLALSDAQVTFRRLLDDSVNMRQVLSLNWSDERERAMEHALIQAQDRLTREDR